KAGSAAEKAGLQAGDVVESIDGVGIRRVEELRQGVLIGTRDPTTLMLKRNGQPMTVIATPDIVAEKDILGNTTKVGQLGILQSSDSVLRHEDPVTAVWRAASETWSITTSSLATIGQMIIGR